MAGNGPGAAPGPMGAIADRDWNRRCRSHPGGPLPAAPQIQKNNYGQADPSEGANEDQGHRLKRAHGAKARFGQEAHWSCPDGLGTCGSSNVWEWSACEDTSPCFPQWSGSADCVTLWVIVSACHRGEARPLGDADEVIGTQDNVRPVSPGTPYLTPRPTCLPTRLHRKKQPGELDSKPQLYWVPAPPWLKTRLAWLETQKNPGFPGFSLCAEGDLNPHPLSRTSTSS